MSKLAELEKLIEPLVVSNDFELVDLQYLSEGGKWVLRVFIDSKDIATPVKINDCVKISEILGDAIDNSNLIDRSYILEVSSPGINRPLKKPRDFIKFKNKIIKVSTFAPDQNGQRNFKGKIIDFQNDTLTLEVENKKMFLNIKQIARAQLEPEI